MRLRRPQHTGCSATCAQRAHLQQARCPCVHLEGRIGWICGVRPCCAAEMCACRRMCPIQLQQCKHVQISVRRLKSTQCRRCIQAVWSFPVLTSGLLRVCLDHERACAKRKLAHLWTCRESRSDSERDCNGNQTLWSTSVAFQAGALSVQTARWCPGLLRACASELPPIKSAVQALICVVPSPLPPDSETGANVTNLRIGAGDLQRAAAEAAEITRRAAAARQTDVEEQECSA